MTRIIAGIGADGDSPAVRLPGAQSTVQAFLLAVTHGMTVQAKAVFSH